MAEVLAAIAASQDPALAEFRELVGRVADVPEPEPEPTPEETQAQKLLAAARALKDVLDFPDFGWGW